MDSRQENVINKIFLGEVSSVHNYGAFISIPGQRKQGLIHRSQVSKVPVDDVTEVLQKGERVWCKIVNVTDDGKIGLSMKVVDQGSGKDLDPNGVQVNQDERKRKAYSSGSGKKAIVLEAVLNTTCTKCGTKGHMSKDCFTGSSGKTYELIPEEEELVQENISTVPQQTPNLNNKKHVKEKKSKKRKKNKKTKKKKKYSSSSSSTSSSSSADSSESSDSSSHQSHKRKKRKRSRSPQARKKHRKLM